jgi:hypothetical protein
MLEGACHCGQVRWTFEGMPDGAGATACNCTICRRYGVLWIYGFEGEGIRVSGATKAYARGEKPTMGFHFCPNCGCVAYWRDTDAGKDGRRRIAVNVRLSEPETVADLPIDHFDGLDKFEDLPRDGKCVADYWF